MTDTLSMEVKLPEYSSAEVFSKETSDNNVTLSGDITVMKTEVIEELCDFPTINNIEFVDVNMELTNTTILSSTNECFDLGKCKNEEEEFLKTEDNSLNHNVNICSLCQVEISDENSYFQHIKWCENNHFGLNKKDKIITKNNTIFTCNQCNYITNNKHNLYTHKRVHNNDRLYTCKICSKSFKWKSSLDYHYVTHQLKMSCDYCNNSYRTQTALEKHISEKHLKPKNINYKCEICDYDTYSKGNLTTHARIHTNEKPFKCTYKNCKCTSQEESCECDPCGYATAQKSNLKTHISMKHIAETKTYECGNCNYITHTKIKLVRHMQIHPNE